MTNELYTQEDARGGYYTMLAQTTTYGTKTTERRKTYQEEMTFVKQLRSINYKRFQQSQTERSNAFWVAEERVPVRCTVLRDASLTLGYLHIYIYHKYATTV